mmetsp:Transcript_17551/g.30921  ORF Transcript_17551/g.30921 Transcript_17551/m.30921 type:complete len:255 (+) Transcript_17551:862-1626(+)
MDHPGGGRAQRVGAHHGGGAGRPVPERAQGRARGGRGGPAGPHGDPGRGPRAAGGRRAPGAVRRQDLLVRAGHVPDPGGLRPPRLGRGPGRVRPHLEGRLHHPRGLPRPHQGRLRPGRGAAQPAGGPGLRAGAQRAPALLAQGGLPGRGQRHRHALLGGLAGLLRRLPPRAAAGQPHAGPAGLLRGPHLRAPGPGGQLPLRLERGAQGHRRRERARRGRALTGPALSAGRGGAGGGCPGLLSLVQLAAASGQVP